MQLSRITATVGAVALGGLLAASTPNAGASASSHHPRPAHQRVMVYPQVAERWHHTVRVDLRFRIGRHCGSMATSM